MASIYTVKAARLRNLRVYVQWTLSTAVIHLELAFLDHFVFTLIVKETNSKKKFIDSLFFTCYGNGNGMVMLWFIRPWFFRVSWTKKVLKNFRFRVHNDGVILWRILRVLNLLWSGWVRFRWNKLENKNMLSNLPGLIMILSSFESTYLPIWSPTLYRINVYRVKYQVCTYTSPSDNR